LALGIFSSTSLYYRARYYDSQTGRFISEDSSKFEANLSLYVYAGNTPTAYIDSLGTESEKPSLDSAVSQDAAAQITVGFNAALARLKNDNCKKLFGCNAEAKLRSTTYFTYKGGAEGGYTDPNHKDVYLNLQGALFNARSDGYIKLPRQNGNGHYLLGDAAAVQAFVLLHELGHELSDVTGFVPDGGKGNESKNRDNSLKLLGKCFLDARLMTE